VDTHRRLARLPRPGRRGALFNEGTGHTAPRGPRQTRWHGAGHWAVKRERRPRPSRRDASAGHQSVDDELEALFETWTTPEPATGEFKEAEGPESEADAEPATKAEGGQGRMMMTS
jgi:hypothetical protein